MQELIKKLRATNEPQEQHEIKMQIDELEEKIYGN